MADIFQPVRGTQAAINRQPIREGYVYYAYDSGRIYLDKDGNRYLMSTASGGGGNGTGIIYANGNDDNIISKHPEIQYNDEFTILLSALEIEVLPEENNLILNSDGRFFRVISVDNENQTIDALLLAVSGTGGGGEPAVVYSDKAKLNKKDPESSYLINGKEATIQVYAVSGKDWDGSLLDEKLTVYWTLSERLETGVLSQYAQGNFQINATVDEENPVWETFEYGTKSRNSTTNVLTMYAKGSSSTASREFTYEFYTSNLELLSHSNFNNINTYSPSDVTIYCTAIGDLEKIIYFYFESNGEMICLNPRGNVLPSGTNEVSYTVDQNYATHGQHMVRIELYQYINGKVDMTSAATPIEMEIGVVDSSNSKPVIWLGKYDSEYYQYDSIRIPFRVYDPVATLGTTVTLFKDSTKIGTRTITDVENFTIWEIVDADLGMQNYYTIACGKEENEVRREITFLVSEDPNRAGMKIAEAGLRYVFNASGRSNSESAASRVKCSYTNNDSTIEAQFDNFNWYNNGWMMDDKGNSCLRISNGAKFTIPLGQTKFATQNASNQSHTFEFQFKVRNVQDYSQIIHNVTRYRANTEATHGRTFGSWTDDFSYNGDPSVYQAFTERTYLEWSNGRVYDNYDAFLQWYLPEYANHHPELLDPNQQIFPPSYDDLEFRKVEKILSTNYASGKYYDGTHGICIGAQDALFTNGVDTVNVAYVEDKIINLTVVYSHGNGEDGGSNKLMSIYLNGMLTGVCRSTLDSNWNIGETNNINIVFDSQYCDFDLYKIRVYNQGLTLSSIVTNYMVDLKDPVGYDLSQLAVLNNSLNESQLVYSNMINYNNAHPDGYIMPYIIFTTNPTSGNVLPYSKQVPIPDVTVEFVNTGLDRAYVTGELNELADRAGQTVEEYYMHHCPSWKGENVAMSVQGTSSEFYPRRNYKAKTKNNDDPYNKDSAKTVHMYMNRGPFAQKYVEDKPSTHLDWFYMDNDTVGTTKFTLKIDYMESSGTYNMGFANLVNNAYSHHPYYDYIKAGAFQKESTDYSVIDMSTAVYDDSKTYWYKNHKGNMKNTDEDELKTIHTEADPAAAFAMGPRDYGLSIGQNKVNTDDNNWYEAVTVYSDIGLNDLKINDLRTSVQGFPALAFHQQTDENGNAMGSPIYIGRYNVLLDKGSDEAYGFKMDGVFQKFVQKKGKPQKISKVAECWEGENNSRGFCSFRDAVTNRGESDDRFFDTDKLTSYGAPVVADYWEYRYHDKADSLDVLYQLNANINDDESIALVLDECDIDISNPTAAVNPDPKYVGTYTQGMADAGAALLDIYSNWEKAVKWVWGTDQDSVPSAGTYSPVDVGVEVYAPNTYYIAVTDNDVLTYELDQSVTYDEEKTYYKDNNGVLVVKLCASSDLLYAANKFYIDSGLGDYVLDPDGVFNNDTQYYYLNKDEANSGAKILDTPVEYNGITYSYDTKEYRNAKFVNDLSKHFNLEYLVTYFVMTEVFECYDSRGKNSMFASWGPQAEGGEYIWYPCFYDIDTQLGINNTGIPSFEYYVDATEDGTFSTNDSVLWNNLYRNFKGAIVQKYRQLRGNSSTYDRLAIAPLSTIERIEKWYLGDPVECKSIAMRGERPIIALNLDEYYKYITITNSRAGYQNRYGTTDYDNGTYFYMLQGDRSLSRQQFLTNRLNYIDSWLNQGQYERGGNNVIRGRISANRPSIQSDKWIEGNNSGSESALININTPYWTDETETQKTHMFDGEYWVNMEPVRNSYVTMGTDAANFPSQKYTNLEGPVHFIATDLENAVRTSGGYSEQLLYIYGIDQMKSLGDMSKLYWTELEFQVNAAKMTDLLLGYDGIDENGDHYKNSGINMYSLRASSSASDKGGMPLLKKANLSYITFNDQAPTFNFTSCEKLQDFRAIGSNITNVSFATGVALRTLYLPETIRALSLTEATQLKNIVTSFRVRDDLNGIDVKEGLYIPGLTDAVTPQSASSNIIMISLIGDYLGYDSYKLLLNYYHARTGANASQITVTGVDWSPYKPLSKGYEYNAADAEAGLYWLDNGHYSFDAYTANDYTEDSWNLAIQNNELYRLDPNADGSIIKTTELLENLRDNNKFFSTAAEDNEIPIISGIIYIDNDEAVNEKDVESSLGLAYPELKFFFKRINKVPTAKYVVLNDDGTYDLLARRSLGDNETFFPDPMTISTIDQSLLDNYDTRSQYDFYGWSTEPLSPAAVNELGDEEWYKAAKHHLIKTTTNTNILPSSEQYNYWDSQTRENDKYDYVFYAVYYIHKYKMDYYDGDGSVLVTMYVPANSSIVRYTPTNAYPTKTIEDTEENFYYVEKFSGWALTPNGQAEEWTEANIGRASKDRSFYPTFVKDSVYNNVLDESWLYNDSDGNGRFNKTGLKGKITLPAVVGGYPIREFRAYYAQPEVTHIFWQKDNNQLQSYGIGAFGTGYNTMNQVVNEPFANLIYAEIPNSNFNISREAFKFCRNLFNSSGVTQDIVDDFFLKIVSYGQQAFMETNKVDGSLGFLHNKILKLPSTITSIGRQVFQSAFIRKVEFGDPLNSFGYIQYLNDTSKWNMNGIMPMAGIYQINAVYATIEIYAPNITLYYDPNGIIMDDDTKELFLNRLFGNNYSQTLSTIEYIPVP